MHASSNKQVYMHEKILYIWKENPETNKIKLTGHSRKIELTCASSSHASLIDMAISIPPRSRCFLFLNGLLSTGLTLNDFTVVRRK